VRAARLGCLITPIRIRRGAEDIFLLDGQLQWMVSGYPQTATTALTKNQRVTRFFRMLLTHYAHSAYCIRMMNAYAYLRVSGMGQVDGDGFTRQSDAISRYSASAGISVVQTFREEGVSGAKDLDNRPALQELLLATEAGDVLTVLIERLDRLARDLMVQETILADLRKRGITVISVAEPDLCSDDPSRVLMRQLFGAVAQYEKSMIVLKLRGARQRMRARTGRCEGSKPFGAVDCHRATIERILALRGTGMAVDTIAETLNVEGLKSKTGGRWYGSSVRNVILREQRVA
jgi:DNA invertase Pin-like site-specific DNA recombinase